MALRDAFFGRFKPLTRRKPEVFRRQNLGDREAVMDFGDIDVLWQQSSLSIRLRRCAFCCRNACQRAPVVQRRITRLSAANDVERILGKITRDFLAYEQNCCRTIRNRRTIEQPQRPEIIGLARSSCKNAISSAHSGTGLTCACDFTLHDRADRCAELRIGIECAVVVILDANRIRASGVIPYSCI